MCAESKEGSVKGDSSVLQAAAIPYVVRSTIGFLSVRPDDHMLSTVTLYESRSFAVCGPAAWDSLPAAVQDLSSSSSCFCSHLKTELFVGRMALIHRSTFVIA